jgi:lipoate-protein ligase B
MTSSNSTDLQPEMEIEVRRHSKESPWTYTMLDARQREIAKRVLDGGPGALLLSELSPVITVGRRAAPTDLLLPREMLARAGVEVVPTDRGGLATWHGPGQWVLFAVDNLERLTGDRRGVRKAVDALLGIALEVGKTYDPSAEIRSGAEMGVWTSRGKFAALGVHIDHGVLLHGLSVNGFKSETSFMGLRPCGLDLPVDYLVNDIVRERPSEFETLGHKILAQAQNTFTNR